MSDLGCTMPYANTVNLLSGIKEAKQWLTMAQACEPEALDTRKQME